MPASSSSSSPAPDFIKVPGIPGLYRKTRSGVYLGIKVAGQVQERSLKTNDRRIAERRRKAWIEELGRVDTSVEKTTLEDLFKRLLAVHARKSASSSTSLGTNSSDRPWSHPKTRWLRLISELGHGDVPQYSQ